jgi:hypothetical protein
MINIGSSYSFKISSINSRRGLSLAIYVEYTFKANPSIRISIMMWNSSECMATNTIIMKIVKIGGYEDREDRGL